MQSYLYIVLIAACCSNISMKNPPRGRVRIADLSILQNNHKRQSIPHVDNTNLPIGYNPRRRYNNHHSSLYPLREGELFRAPSLPTKPSHDPIPLLRETKQSEPQINSRLEPNSHWNSNAGLNTVQVQPGTIIETIVYGQWKPEHPIKPKEISHESHEDLEQRPRKRIYGRLESILMGTPIDSHKSAENQKDLQSYEHSQNFASYNATDSKFGSSRIPTTTTTTSMPPTPNLVSINNTDSLPIEEDNDSIELNSNESEQYQEYFEMDDRISILHTTNDNTWIPMVPSDSNDDEYLKQTSPMMVADIADTTSLNATTMPTTRRATTTTTATPMSREVMETTLNLLNWPTDFLVPTTEQPQQPKFKLRSELESKNFEDMLNSAQMNSDLSIAESLMPQLNSLNITQVGVPYEDWNSAEEPTICVPVTVTETSVSSEGEEMIQVERVYCFPLPKVEVKGTNKDDQKGWNATVRLDELDVRQAISGAHLKRFNLLVTSIIWYLSWHLS